MKPITAFRHQSQFFDRSIVDTPDVHGFVMSGTCSLFLHHLAMFHEHNHRYQVILRVTIPAHAMTAYVEAKNGNPNQAYILGNISSDLMTLPDLHTHSRTIFIADMFAGMPDSNAIPLVHNFPVTIDRVVYFRPLNDQDTYPRLLTYLLYGENREAHLAHLLVRADDFDNVLDLDRAPDWLPPQQLRAGAQVQFPELPFKPPYKKSPLDGVNSVTFQGQSTLFTVTVHKNYWFDCEMINSIHTESTSKSFEQGDACEKPC